MSHPTNEQILDQAREEWEVAYDAKDFHAMRGIIKRLHDGGFDNQADTLAGELIDLEDAMQ